MGMRMKKGVMMFRSLFVSSVSGICKKGGKLFGVQGVQLAHQIMEHRAGKEAGEQVEEEALELHVLALEDAQEDEHIGADQELGDAATPQLPSPGERRIGPYSGPQSGPDVPEAVQVKAVAGGPPQHHGDNPKRGSQQQGHLEPRDVKLVLPCHSRTSCTVYNGRDGRSYLPAALSADQKARTARTHQ